MSAVDADELLDALMAAAAGGSLGYFTDLASRDVGTAFELTCAVANAINVLVLDQSTPGMAALKIEGDPESVEHGRTALQAMRIVACIANNDFEMALAVWGAGTSEQAVKATAFLIRLTIDLIRSDIEEAPHVQS